MILGVFFNTSTFSTNHCWYLSFKIIKRDENHLKFLMSFIFFFSDELTRNKTLVALFRLHSRWVHKSIQLGFQQKTSFKKPIVSTIKIHVIIRPIIDFWQPHISICSSVPLLIYLISFFSFFIETSLDETRIRTDLRLSETTQRNTKKFNLKFII